MGVNTRIHAVPFGRYAKVRRPLSSPTTNNTMATTNSTWTIGPIVNVPTRPSSQAISRMTAMVYSMVNFPRYVGFIFDPPITRVEAIDNSDAPSMHHPPTRACAFEHRCTWQPSEHGPRQSWRMTVVGPHVMERSDSAC
jgi:hypothetical protein